MQTETFEYPIHISSTSYITQQSVNNIGLLLGLIEVILDLSRSVLVVGYLSEIHSPSPTINYKNIWQSLSSWHFIAVYS